MGSALLVHAVIIYCRATHTRAIKRFNVGVTRADDKASKAKHAEIVRLRDLCMAHFGAGDDLWHDERILYVEQDNENGVCLAHRRTNFSIYTIEDLDALLVAALELERAIELGAAITNADKQAWAIIDDHEFDIDRFFDAPGLRGMAHEKAAFEQNLWETKRGHAGKA